ncbi:hypothetical protein ACFL5B_01605 [Candidatus Latescibacterota bacterium]
MRIAHAVVSLALIMCLSESAAYAQGTIPRQVSKKYPEDRYIHRLGTGETSEQAADAARFEITKYFESKISGETIVNQWGQIAGVKGKTIEKHLTEVSNTVIVGASRDIPGIEIAQTERNRRQNNYETWAVLEKSKYAGILGERIQGLDRKVDDRLKQANGTDLDLVRIYSGVMRDLVLRQQYAQDLFLLESGTAVQPRDSLLRSVMTSLDSIITVSFDVGIIFNGEIGDDVKSGIISGIVDAGIRLREYPDVPSAADSGSDLAMIVEHNASPKIAKFRDREFHNIDWVLSVKAVVPASVKVIDALVQNDKLAGAQNQSQAESRMVKKILEAHVPSITSWVYQVIFKPEE